MIAAIVYKLEGNDSASWAFVFAAIAFIRANEKEMETLSVRTCNSFLRTHLISVDKELNRTKYELEEIKAFLPELKVKYTKDDCKGLVLHLDIDKFNEHVVEMQKAENNE